MIQLYIYTHSLLFRFFSHIELHNTLGIIPCAIQQFHRELYMELLTNPYTTECIWHTVSLYLFLKMVEIHNNLSKLIIKLCWLQQIMHYQEFPSWLTSNDPAGIHEDSGSISGLTQCWLRIQHCCELWYSSQILLGSSIAVAVEVASSCNSDSTPNLGTSICHKCSPKKAK